MGPLPRLKPYAGPAILAHGFRPFSLLESNWTGLVVSARLPIFYGPLAVATAFSPLDWRVYELPLAYVPVIVTGFLLTAIPNWTECQPLQGAPLLGPVLA